MSFSENTEKLVNELIQAEYKNACENYGDKYNSLHEAYAVLLEEVEETENELQFLKGYQKLLWSKIKNEKFNLYTEKELIAELKKATQKTMQELAQVGAVLMKMQNTLEVEE